MAQGRNTDYFIDNQIDTFQLSKKRTGIHNVLQDFPIYV